jgi:hypothetical protein
MNMEPFDTQEADEFIIEQVQKLRPVSSRDPGRQASGRAHFLAQADQLRRERFAFVPLLNSILFNKQTIPVANGRLGGRKELRPMFSAIVSLLVGITLLFGSAGAVAYAAQDSLPTDLLYPVKTLTESIRLELARDPQQQLGLLLEQNDRRVDEAAGLALRSEAVPEEVAGQLERQVKEAFQLALQLDKDEAPEAMDQIRANLRRQDQVMNMTRTNIPDNADPVMNQIRETVEMHIRLAGEPGEDPVALKYRLNKQFGKEAEDAEAAINEAPEDGYGLQGTDGPGPYEDKPGPNAEFGPAAGPQAYPGYKPAPGQESRPGGDGQSQYGPGGETYWNEAGSNNEATPSSGEKK